MYKLFALLSIIFPLFINVAGHKHWGRQDIITSASPFTVNVAPSTSNSSFNATAAIINALNDNGIPPSCDSECIPPFNTTASCQDLSCRCTNEYEKSLFDCYLCAGDVLNAKFDTVQNVIDTLNRDCFQIGFNLTKLTFPGEDPNRTITSSFSSVAFTLPVPTSAATNTQNINVQPHVTQGTTGNDTSPSSAGQSSAPSAAPTNGGDKKMTAGAIIPLVLMLLGFL